MRLDVILICLKWQIYEKTRENIVVICFKIVFLNGSYFFNLKEYSCFIAGFNNNKKYFSISL